MASTLYLPFSFLTPRPTLFMFSICVHNKVWKSSIALYPASSPWRRRMGTMYGRVGLTCCFSCVHNKVWKSSIAMYPGSSSPGRKSLGTMYGRVDLTCCFSCVHNKVWKSSARQIRSGLIHHVNNVRWM